MIKITDLAISFVGKTLFKDVNIALNNNDKIGLIGQNGCGKSTFFKLLLQQLEADEGEIIIPKGYKIGHLAQHIKFTHQTVIDEVCSTLPEERQYETWKGEEILMGLGFSLDDILLKSPHDFSGGYQVKINLAKLLLNEPNMLLLDEPTNYLDIHSVRWLKKFLRNWDGELILITHDRDFMDSIISHTLHIYRGNFKKIPGNTEKIHEKIAISEEIYEKTRINEAKQREKTEAWINRFKAKASMAKRAQSKMKQLAKEDRKEKLQDIATLDFKFNHLDKSIKDDIASVENLCFGYDEQKIIKQLSFQVEPEDKICVIGKNGKGKSTLLKLIMNNLAPNSGKITTHEKTEIGYFGQMNIDQLNPERSIYEELQNSAPTVNETKIRGVCGNMMFPGGLSNKKISVLSGGEKSRVMLGKILLKPANLLLLDEPTNHLDMESCESLLTAIQYFPAAVIMVTHSEYFLKEAANKLIVFDNDETFVFEGSYQDFLKKVGWSDEK